MLATGLTILKIIGFILLGILALLLAIVLAVLFVPVRYRMEGSRYDEWKASIKFSWLLHILSFHAVYDGELNTSLRIFGFHFRRREDEEDFEGAAGDLAEDAVENMADHDAGELADVTDEKRTEQTGRPSEERQTAEEPQRTSADSSRSSSEKAAKKKRTSRKKAFPITKIYDRLLAIKEKLTEVYETLKKEEKTLKLIWKQVKVLVRHISPRRARGKVRFGFDDPYTTGQVLAYISPFYGRYAKGVKIIPVFEEPVLDGELYIRGRIRVGTAVWIILTLWRDQSIRKLWKQWRG